jgi:acyl transferase domain-containing protein
VIGLIKVLLSLRHRQLPALLNFRDINPLIQFEGSPFYITTRNSEWPDIDGAPRMAAINSFGHSGTNAHLVVSEYRPARERVVSSRVSAPLALPLSAKTPEQLQHKCEQLLAHIEANADDIDLRAMACTLQTGREAMEYRIGFAVDSLAALTAALRTHLSGARPGNGVFSGQARRGAGKHVATAADTASLLLQRWTQGISVAWSGLWPAQERPERQRLPGYPFARERYWIASAFGSPSAAAPAPAPDFAAEPSIEQILDRIADDSIATEQGVRLLKAIV